MKKYIITMTVVFLTVGCSLAGAEKPSFQKEGEQISNKIAEYTSKAVPFPTEQVRDSLERRNLCERLLRFNQPEKVGYLYVVGLNGNIVGYYTIKGKVSSVQSQLTQPEQTWKDGCGSSCENITVVSSVGDDGSYGPNEGGDDGVFFFTTNGVLVETTLDFIYSDAPLAVKAPSLVAKDARPSSTSTNR